MQTPHSKATSNFSLKNTVPCPAWFSRSWASEKWLVCSTDHRARSAVSCGATGAPRATTSVQALQQCSERCKAACKAIKLHAHALLFVVESHFLRKRCSNSPFAGDGGCVIPRRLVQRWLSSRRTQLVLEIFRQGASCSAAATPGRGSSPSVGTRRRPSERPMDHAS
jgi:hypothetical protein